MSVFDLRQFNDRIALVDDRREGLSYRELDDSVRQLGDLLPSGEKKLVFILARNNVETIVGYLMALQSGHCAMLLDANLDKAGVDILAQMYKPDFVWGPAADKVAGSPRYGTYALTSIEGASRMKLHPHLALLLSTSGSTGSRKVVRLSASNLISNARSIVDYLSLGETERPVAHLPVHYSYGLSIINSHLIVGATIFLTETPVVRKEFWDFIRNGGVTSLAGVPYTFEMLKRIGFSKMELPTMRYLTQAGGKMNPETVAEVAKTCRHKNVNFFVMYGATEATARMSYLPAAYAELKPGSIGVAIPGGVIRLLDDSGAAVTEPYQVGELVYVGPNVMMGYAVCRDDLSRGDDYGGVLPTGDLACFDEDGFYYISGRKNRFLKMLGKRFGLTDIEDHFESLGWKCICGGADDRLVVASHRDNHDRHNLTFKDIKKETCRKFKLPPDLVDVFLIEEIPRSPSGKIRYSDIFTNTIRREGVDDEWKSEGEGTVRQAGT
ncbi:MAG TPA: AMP-binding protein [Geobacteraceae bacterium]